MEVILTIISKISLVKLVFGFLFFAYWIYAFFIIYHLVRFGIGPKPKLAALIFFLGSVFLFTLAAGAYSQVDVSKISLFGDLEFNIWPKFPEINY